MYRKSGVKKSSNRPKKGNSKTKVNRNPHAYSFSTSLILTILITLIIYNYFGAAVIIQQPSQSVNISVDPTEHSFLLSLAPGYFYSRANIYVATQSPYIECFNEFNQEMTFNEDKNSWVRVPNYTKSPDKNEISKFADLGPINLDQLTLRIYERDYIPPQNLTPLCPPQIQKKDIYFTTIIMIKRIITPEDWILLFLTSFSIFGTIYGLLDSILVDKFKSKK